MFMVGMIIGWFVGVIMTLTFGAWLTGDLD